MPGEEKDQPWIVKWGSTLDAATERKAREELHEIPEDRESAIQALKEWVISQPHLNVEPERHWLLALLRGSKFSQLRARAMAEGQLNMFTEHPQWFRGIDPQDPKLQAIIDRGYSIPLPKRDKNGCRILLYRIASLDPDTKLYNHNDTIRAAMVSGFLMAHDEMTQVNGHVFIFDFTGLTMKHVTGMMNQQDMKKWHKVWQKNMPGRFKAFHYYNTGVFFETMMAIARPFLDKKYQDRIIVHENLESLYKHVGKELLPEEYLPDDYKGPSIGSMAQLIADYKKDIAHPNFRELIMEATNKIGVDMSKKPKEEAPTTMFRKLNVD